MIVIRSSKRIAKWAKKSGATLRRVVSYSIEDYSSFKQACHARAGVEQVEYLVRNEWIAERDLYLDYAYTQD